MFCEVEVIKDGEKTTDLVAEERELCLIVNDRLVARVKLSPGHEEEFALGYCFSEGLIKDMGQIEEITVVENTVEIKADASFELVYENYVLSDCISGWRARAVSEDVAVDSNLKIEARKILENMLELRKRSKVWQKTGGVHSVALVHGNDFLNAEDVSRHIAVDKVIGMGIKKGVDFSKSHILTSGRMPGDMVIKAARVNIPIIASRTAPLSSGVECAGQTNLTLIGFVRKGGMNVYSHADRIIW